MEDRVATEGAYAQRADGDVAGSVEVKFLDDRAGPADDREGPPPETTSGLAYRPGRRTILPPVDGVALTAA